MSTILQERRQPIVTPKLRDQASAQRVTLHARWRLMLGSMVATLRDWRRRSIDRSELARLDERTLRDIGVDPGAVDYETRQSFWRPRRDWRD